MTPTAGPSTSERRQGARLELDDRAAATQSHRHPIRRKPPWIRVKAPTSPELSRDPPADARAKACTRCARRRPAPTSASAGQQGHATVMILGDTCTRACAFCNVEDRPARAVDPHEPEHLAEARRRAGPRARRDHLGRPRRSARTAAPSSSCAASRRSGDASPATTIEVLTPDFLRKPGAIEKRRRRRARRLQPQPRDRAAALSRRCGPARATSIRCACSTGSRSWIRRCSPSPASWSGWARRSARSCR